jgi:hypothetical protein
MEDEMSDWLRRSMQRLCRHQWGEARWVDVGGWRRVCNRCGAVDEDLRGNPIPQAGWSAAKPAPAGAYEAFVRRLASRENPADGTREAGRC